MADFKGLYPKSPLISQAKIIDVWDCLAGPGSPKI